MNLNLQPLNRIWQNWQLTGSKYSMSSTKFLLGGGGLEKLTKMAALASSWLRGFWLSATAEQYLTKLNRKQVFNILHEVLCFWGRWGKKMAALASDWLRIFSFSSVTYEKNFIISELKGSKYLLSSTIFLSPAFCESGGIKSHSSVCPSVCPSVTKTLTWLISSEVLMVEYWCLACMILVTSPFHWYHVVTLTFYLLQGQICGQAGDHNSSNLFVFWFFFKGGLYFNKCG